MNSYNTYEYELIQYEINTLIALNIESVFLKAKTLTLNFTR